MLAGRALIVSILLVGIAVILDCSDAMVAPRDQRQRIPSPKGKRRGVSPGGDELRTKASKQRGRLLMSPKSGKAMISNLVKKPALKASNAFGKTLTWAQDVMDNAMQRTSKVCCEVPLAFFNKTFRDTIMDVTDSESDGRKSSLHDSELDNPWLSDIERDPEWCGRGCDVHPAGQASAEPSLP